MTDFLAFYDPEIALPLMLLGAVFGAFVLWHFPTARQYGALPVLFTLTLTSALPWIFIITFRGIEYTTGSDPTFKTWYRSIGTALMFFGFDLGAAAAITVRERIVTWQAKRAAVLPHGVHVRRDK